MNRPARILTLAIVCLAVLAGPARAEFMKGADLSLVQYIQDHGGEYREAGQVKDPLQIFRDHGGNWVRLRLFLSPNGRRGQVNSLPYTLRLAKRVKQAGFRFLLDLHYSDVWADAGHQVMPAAWTGLSHPQLVDRVFTYTRDTVAAFQKAGGAPDMVAVGNEITDGMLWPDGGPLGQPAKGNDNASPATDKATNTAAQWDRLADLLRAGLRGVHAADTSGTVRTMIHLDKGGNAKVCRWFFDPMLSRGMDFDVIGLSYYPFWHGTLADLQNNLAVLSQACKKDIVVVETANDNDGGPQGKLPCPLTPAGQKAFLDELIRTVAATPDGRGKGVFYWAPEWISGPQWDDPHWTSNWEKRALFDHAGNALPGLRAFEAQP